MSVTRGDTASQATATPTSTPTTGGPAARALAVLRIAFGLTFLWAFVDKLLALGFATGYETGKLDRFGDAAWINGASPTEGFLKFGPTARSRGSTTPSRRRPGRLAVHARPARHRPGAHPRDRDSAGLPRAPSSI